MRVQSTKQKIVLRLSFARYSRKQGNGYSLCTSASSRECNETKN
ncbi:hypothetical protein HMPREF1139_0313 [Campylobacter sp. FOBRC14]|nr:hypothetical protein HMPREF1139_0313 [Campylobacter sp. FOBRC14]